MKTLYIFDLDDTLFYHDNSLLFFNIKDSTGKIVKTIGREEYQSYKCPIGYSVDYSIFESSEIFTKSAKPIRKMIKLLKKLNKRGDSVEIVTARTDLDNKSLFYNFLLSHGIDINKVHVRRVGNMNNGLSTSKRKAIQIGELAQQNKYNKIIFYDDDMDNIKEFINLSMKLEGIKLIAYCVSFDEETQKIKKTKYVSKTIKNYT